MRSSSEVDTTVRWYQPSGPEHLEAVLFHRSCVTLRPPQTGNCGLPRKWQIKPGNESGLRRGNRENVRELAASYDPHFYWRARLTRTGSRVACATLHLSRTS